MKLPAISAVVVCLLFFLHAACVVESSRSFRRWHYSNIFVFGDSFADVGNTLDKSGGTVSRAWYYPYGESYSGRTSSRAKSSGRFSDDKVQSDFLARIVGPDEAPTAYNQHGFHLYLNGITFATGGAGVFEVPTNATTISQQVDSFERLLKNGHIARSSFPYSVFLVAVSGNDYEPTMTISNEMLAAKVTDEIVANVNRLRKLGARKILVNNMHPLGCTPRRARYGNGDYTACDQQGNTIASVHNTHLEQKLPNDDTVRVLDINAAFTNIINGTYDSNQFTNRLRPCCDATDPKGYCGRVEVAGFLEFNYKIDMDHVNSYFYWDEMNPTDAGWKAVMKQLEGTIQDFLSTQF